MSAWWVAVSKKSVVPVYLSPDKRDIRTLSAAMKFDTRGKCVEWIIGNGLGPSYCEEEIDDGTV